MVYTSFQNAGMRLAVLFACIFVFAVVAFPAQSFLGMLLSPRWDEYLATAVGAAAFFVAARYLLRPADIASAYFYVRNDLDIKISYSEAKEVAFLFVPNRSGRWYPLEDLLNVPAADRKRALYDFANRHRTTARARA